MDNVMKMVDARTCTGCGICLASCPYGNLCMKPGKLGFPIPHVQDSALCSNCNQCLRACPFSDEFESTVYKGLHRVTV